VRPSYRTALGAIAGEELTRRWPLLAEVMPFALPALFLLLIIPKFVSRAWVISLSTTALIALTLKLSGLINAAIPLAAACGMLLYYAVDYREKHRG
jgi:predicted branched-subunit amino acid permease